MFEIQGERTFTNTLSSIIDYLTPFYDMWPFYLFKAAGIRSSNRWLLRYLSLEGRFDNNMGDRPVNTQGELIFAVKKLVSCEDGWKILQCLLKSGTININDVDMHFPMDVVVPVCHNTLVTNKGIDGISWTYLTVNGSLSENITGDLYYQIRSAAEKFGHPDFENFTEHRVGDRCRQDQLYYKFEFPLGLRVRRGATKLTEEKAELDIWWRKPLSLESLTVKSGPLFETGDVLQILNRVEFAEGWTGGLVYPSLDCTSIWFSSPHLDKPLSYDLPILTVYDQATEAVKYLYEQYGSGKGEHRWKGDLLTEDNGPFEIALLNTIVRFGYAVHFGGQIKSVCPKCSQVIQIGPGTPNYDLLVLDHLHKRALLISAKGSSKKSSKNFPDNADASKLAKSIDKLKEVMHGWHVYGVLACQAEKKEGEGSPVLERRDVRILWKEDLVTLFESNDRSQIEMILWQPPRSDMPSFLWHL